MSGSREDLRRGAALIAIALVLPGIAAIGRVARAPEEHPPLELSAGSSCSSDARALLLGARLDLNAADAAAFAALPEIGPKTAERIVSDRLARGSFAAPGEIERVKGIGKKRGARIEALLCVKD